jgi:type II secretory pathway component GspD/PulD (secretin)
LLKVTPRISANDYVNLKISPSVSRLGPPVASKVGGTDNVVDSFLTRQLDTRVLIPSGNTLVMGGLIQDEINNNNTKVPILGDIPGLGLLFRVDDKKRDKGNLVIFITPTIIQDEDFQPTKTGYLKQHFPAHDSLEEDWSAWDSGKPKDWSKKKAVPQDPASDNGLGQLSPPSGIPSSATAPASEKAASGQPAFDEHLGESSTPSGLPASTTASASH